MNVKYFKHKKHLIDVSYWHRSSCTELSAEKYHPADTGQQMLWAELCVPSPPKFACWSPNSQYLTVTVFGDGAFNEVIKLKEGG